MTLQSKPEWDNLDLFSDSQEAIDTPMSEIERSELAGYEQVIEQGLQTFYEVGTALLAIREKRLYRAEYGTFEAYCRERWNMSRDNAYKYMRSTEAFDNLLPEGNVDDHQHQPANLEQVYPLSRLKGADQQREAWKRAIDTAPERHGQIQVTGAHVKQVVDEMLGKTPPTPQPDIDLETGEILDDDEPEQSFNYKRDVKAARAATPYQPQGNDACQTPPYAIDPLLPFLDTRLTVWEPAAGEQSLVEAFYDCGFDNVVASDMITGQNFLEYEPDEHWDLIITNPPFTLKFEFLERCYELGKPFALLVPVETLGAGKAQALMSEFGFEIMLLSRRVDFKMPNAGWSGAGSQFPVLWLCWQLLPAPVVFGDIPLDVKREFHAQQNAAIQERQER